MKEKYILHGEYPVYIDKYMPESEKKEILHTLLHTTYRRTKIVRVATPPSTAAVRRGVEDGMKDYVDDEGQYWTRGTHWVRNTPYTYPCWHKGLPDTNTPSSEHEEVIIDIEGPIDDD